MKIKTVFELESDDMARPHHIETVMAMLGLRWLEDVPAPTPRRPDQMAVHPDRRIFNLIRNGGASLEDLETASEIVARRAADLRERAETEKPFLEERVNRDYADGLRSTAALAEREWQTFLDLFNEDLQAAA